MSQNSLKNLLKLKLLNSQKLLKLKKQRQPQSHKKVKKLKQLLLLMIMLNNFINNLRNLDLDQQLLFIWEPTLFYHQKSNLVDHSIWFLKKMSWSLYQAIISKKDKLENQRLLQQRKKLKLKQNKNPNRPKLNKKNLHNPNLLDKLIDLIH